MSLRNVLNLWSSPAWGAKWRVIASAASRRALRGLLLTCLGMGAAHQALAQHFDVELRTDKGPVAGSRIVTDFFGDLGLAGQLPLDGVTGYRLFPAYFGDFPGGKYATANPGFQAFGGHFAAGEQVHFRALGHLQFWSPATRRWGAAPAGVTVTLFGGIPPEVVLGYSTNPALWADQYAYHAAGTRFDQQGIAGPLTALIDETKAGGVFHSHLDWKVSAASGQVPVGAYLVTLELWSPVLVNGQPKYQSSQPFHVIFEAGINAQQMQQAFDGRINPPCASQFLSWISGGAQCSAFAQETGSGESLQIDDNSGPATGSARFSCSAGRWGSASQASCSVPPPADCAAQTLSWNMGGQSCSAPVSASGSGSSVLAKDTVQPTLGEASFSCSNGQWSAPSRAACTLTPPAACTAQAVTWTVGAVACTASLSASASGLSQTVVDKEGPNTGQANFACSDGRWSAPSAASCTVTVPATCPARNVGWEVGGLACAATLPQTATGATAVAVDQQGPLTGSARYACVQGVWSGASEASCQAPPPEPCPALSLSWVQGVERCEAVAPASPSGSVRQLLDNTLPNTGSAQFRCTDGRWSEASEALCQAPLVKPLLPAHVPTSPWTPSVQMPWERPRR